MHPKRTAKVGPVWGIHPALALTYVDALFRETRKGRLVDNSQERFLSRSKQAARYGGHYFRNSTEHVLFATLGEPQEHHTR